MHRLGFDKGTNGERITVYLRRLKRSSCYYARYHITKHDLANGQRYITESLRTDHLETALERARQRLADIQHKEESRIALKPLTVTEALDKFLHQYEQGVRADVPNFSVAMLRGYRAALGHNFRAFVGDKSLSAITVDDLTDYPAWRINYAKDQDRHRTGRSKDTVTNRTIHWELNSAKAFLRWCAYKGHYSGKAYEYVFKGSELNKRSALTLDQYRKLFRYMRTDNFALVGRWGNDKRAMRQRQMMRAYILFLANTGLRVGEARYLAWHDVEARKNTQGREVLLVHVAAAESKWRKSRTAVGRHTAKIALDRWRAYKEANGEEVTPNAYIFADEFGQPYQQLNPTFHKVLEECGCLYDTQGEKLTLYCLRHTYLTMRIRFGKNLDIFKLAQNAGTSVQMLQNYYSDARPQDFIDELT